MEYASKGVGNTALGLSIGALGVEALTGGLSGLLGNLGNRGAAVDTAAMMAPVMGALAGAAMNSGKSGCSENTPVSRYELGLQQTIAALGGFHLFSNGGNTALTGLNRFSGRRPTGTRKGELAVALVNFSGSFLHCALRTVQFGLRRGECVRRVLRRLFQRDVLTFQLLDFLNGSAIFALISVQICLCSNRRRIRFAERILIVLISCAALATSAFSCCCLSFASASRCA